jgi:hypothetical protein
LKHDGSGGRDTSWLPRVTTWAAIALVVSASAWAIELWTRGAAIDLIREHGPLEQLHMVALAVSAVLFGQAYQRGQGPVRVAGGALAMLAIAAFVRELDVKNIGGPEWFHFLAEHGLQEVLLIGMTLPIFIYLIRQRQYFWDLVDLALQWRSWPLFLSGALLATGVYLDERIVTDHVMRFWEELLETYGYGFMVMAAWRHRALADPNQQHSGNQTAGDQADGKT